MDYAPFVFLEYDHEPGLHGLLLFDGSMGPADDVFETHGIEPNGHSWNALAQGIVEVQLPEIGPRLAYDSEAGMFAVRSTDLDALQHLAGILHQAFHDHALLSELILRSSAFLHHH